MSGDKSKQNIADQSTADSVSMFLAKVAATPIVKSAKGRGRLLFAMDATASRERTWDQACHLQAELFHASDGLGGLEVQLLYFRGYRECKSSPWVSTSEDLVRRMERVRCVGGRTQIRRVLRHTIKENQNKKVNALVFVGDCFEEQIDDVCDVAGELGVRGVPAFMFQEGNDPIATTAFFQIAKLTGGAHCSFDPSSAQQLKELLSAVAVFAAGGHHALEDYSNTNGTKIVRQITKQMR